MKLGWALAVFTSVTLLGACATPRPQFVKPGVTAAERKRDETECVKRSISTIGPRLTFGIFKIDRDLRLVSQEPRL